MPRTENNSTHKRYDQETHKQEKNAQDCNPVGALFTNLCSWGFETEEWFSRVGRIEPTKAIISPAGFAAREVAILVFIPLNFNSKFQEIVKKSQNITLAALLRVLLVFRSTFRKKVYGVLDKFAFPRTTAAVWKVWRWTRFED